MILIYFFLLWFINSVFINKYDLTLDRTDTPSLEEYIIIVITSKYNNNNKKQHTHTTNSSAALQKKKKLVAKMAFAAARMILKDKRRKSKEDFAAAVPPRNRSKVCGIGFLSVVCCCNKCSFLPDLYSMFAFYLYIYIYYQCIPNDEWRFSRLSALNIF